MTSHREDFADAQDRHWTDAERLFGCHAWANADYLYGLSAECGLKAVLKAVLGSEEKAIDERCKLKERYKLHVNKLWPEFLSFAQGREGAAHISMLPTNPPFHNWHISQRYAHREQFEPAYVEPHRDAARAVRVMFQSVIQGGQP